MTPPPYVDDLLPDFDVESRHAIQVAAPADVVYAAARRLDMSSSRAVRLLFLLRGLPPSALNAEGLTRLRFKPLVEDPPHGFALGIVGRFWTPGGQLLDFEPGEFRDIRRPGFARAVWAFDITATRPGSVSLRTVTRVTCADASSRRSFGRYWTVVGPFSGLIRRRILAVVRSSAEGSTRRG